jgi:hypothetical protein
MMLSSRYMSFAWGSILVDIDSGFCNAIDGKCAVDRTRVAVEEHG